MVALEGFWSSTLLIGNSSVLQDNKKSGILYTLFNLEIVFLAMIMRENTTYWRITDYQIEDYSQVGHETVNFVDNLTLVVGAHDPDVFNSYINNFHRLIEAVYFINKLEINKTKSQIMVHKHPEMGGNNWRLTMKTSSEMKYTMSMP